MRKNSRDNYIHPNFSYSDEQVREMYEEDCLNINFRNLYNSGLFNSSFIQLKDMLIRPTVVRDNWGIQTNNETLLNCKNNKLTLAEDIYANGSYWAFVMICREGIDGFITKHGNHRVASLKLMQEKGEIPEDFSLFSFVLTEEFLSSYKVNSADYNMYLDEPVKVRYNIDVIENNVLFKNLFDPTYMRFTHRQKINDYTIETYTNNLYDLFFAYHSYTLYLRDFLVDHHISPTKIFIDQNRFEGWLHA